MSTKRKRVIRKKVALKAKKVSARVRRVIAKRTKNSTKNDKEVIDTPLTARQRLINQTGIGSALTQIPTVGVSQSLQDKAASTEKAVQDSKREKEMLEAQIKENNATIARDTAEKREAKLQSLRQADEIKRKSEQVLELERAIIKKENEDRILKKLNTQIEQGERAKELSKAELEIQTREQELYKHKRILERQNHEIAKATLAHKSEKLQEETMETRLQISANNRMLSNPHFTDTNETLKQNYIDAEKAKFDLELTEKRLAMKREADRNKVKNKILTSNAYEKRMAEAVRDDKQKTAALQQEITDNEIRTKEIELKQIAYDAAVSNHKKAITDRVKSKADLVKEQQKLQSVINYTEGDGGRRLQTEYNNNLQAIFNNDINMADTSSQIEQHELRTKAMADARTELTKLEIANKQETAKADTYKALDAKDDSADIYVRLPLSEQTEWKDNLSEDDIKAVERAKERYANVQAQIEAENQHRSNENEFLKHESRFAYQRKVLTDTYALERENETIKERNIKLNTQETTTDEERLKAISEYETQKINNENQKELNRLAEAKSKLEYEKAYLDSAINTQKTGEVLAAQRKIAENSAITKIHEMQTQKFVELTGHTLQNIDNEQEIQSNLQYILSDDTRRKTILDSGNNIELDRKRKIAEKDSSEEHKRIDDLTAKLNGFVGDLEKYYELSNTVKYYYKTTNQQPMFTKDNSDYKYTYGEIKRSWLDFMRYIKNTYLDINKLRTNKRIGIAIKRDGTNMYFTADQTGTVINAKNEIDIYDTHYYMYQI